MSDHPALFKLSLYEVGLLAETTGRTNQQIMDEQMVERCEHGNIDPHEIISYGQGHNEWDTIIGRCPGSPTLNNKGEDE